MQRQQVKSSNVSEVGYDEVKQILEIKFINGDIYQYLNVPKHIHYSLIESPSIGKAIHTMIRGKFTFKKVEV